MIKHLRETCQLILLSTNKTQTDVRFLIVNNIISSTWYFHGKDSTKLISNKLEARHAVSAATQYLPYTVLAVPAQKPKR